jgi:uncharacterized membrane-anchored protein
VAAISYYLVSLVTYLSKGAQALGVPLEVDVVTAASVPVVLGAAWLGVRRIRRLLERDS